MQYTNLTWRNGQPYSEIFDDIYYSSNEGECISGEHEFQHVFFKHNILPERWHKSENFTIAELGFGSGLNFLLTVREWLKHISKSKQKKCLHYIAIEKYPLSPLAIEELISRYPALKTYCDELLANYPPAVEASHSRHLFNDQVIIHFKFMDVSEALDNERFNVDAWYLDGFSPAKNTDMWSENLFLKMAQNSRINATCSTYTAAGFVKRNMINAGFSVKKVKGYGQKREMLTAIYMGNDKSKQNFTASEYTHSYKDKPWFQGDAKRAIYNEKTAIIIGAGIAGLSTAYALIKRGWSVTIIDKHGAVAKETSANPAAIVYPRLAINDVLNNEFFIGAFCLSISLLRTLQAKYKAQFWFDSGLLQEVDEERSVELIAKYQFNDDFISPFLATAENDVGINLLDGKAKNYLNYKTAGVVLPNVLCDVLKQECGDKLTLVSEKVNNIQVHDDQWQCYSGTSVISSAEVLVIASGAAINDIELPIDLHMDLPVDIVRGQVVELYETKQSKNITCTLASKVTLSPSINGKNYLGASYSRNNMTTEVDRDESIKLLEELNHTYSFDFSQLDIANEWVGFRAMPIDRVPIVGAVADKEFFEREYADICHGRTDKGYPLAKYVKGLYLSLGHGSRGFTSTFLSSEIICAQILGEPLPVRKRVLDYLAPSRFIINNLKRR